jgi:hypothetical protein
MDYVKRDTTLFDNYHFIDYPHWLSDEDKPANVPNAESVNLLAALQIIYKSLKTRGEVSNVWGKGFSTLMLVHLLGDMHQPLHAVSLFSTSMNFTIPVGDMGGNKYTISYTSEFGMFYDRSHLLFDCVAGLWCSYMPHPLTKDYEALIDQETSNLMKDFPAFDYEDSKLFPDISTPDAFFEAVERWALESFEHAKQVYAELPALGGTPSAEFISKWRRLLRERIALAGYRLAYLLENFNFSQIGPAPGEDDHQVSEAWRAFAITFGVLFLGMIVVTTTVWKRARKIQEAALSTSGVNAAAYQAF